ncbi:hypothetical protein chiPu_0010319 [Chiloscyllium punctatum]|uniref:Uncharacterized protein n=1 Tax=Chiloscyllium punctatum TaxID=137246 RepID=A0A401SN80_CHIPU|nr:hypothetical protein [Chiloscyllium punctatum]
MNTPVVVRQLTLLPWQRGRPQQTPEGSYCRKPEYSKRVTPLKDFRDIPEDPNQAEQLSLKKVPNEKRGDGGQERKRRLRNEKQKVAGGRREE